MKFRRTNKFGKFEVKIVKNNGAVSKNVVRVAITPRSPQPSRSTYRSSASSRPIFFGEEGRSFRQETTVHGPQWGRRRWRGMSCSCAVVHRLSKLLKLWASFFLFLIMLSRKTSISKTLMQQRRRDHACAVLPVWCAGHIIVKSVRQVPTLTRWSMQPRSSLLQTNLVMIESKTTSFTVTHLVLKIKEVPSKTENGGKLTGHLRCRRSF